jgi:hypothetical protein
MSRVKVVNGAAILTRSRVTKGLLWAHIARLLRFAAGDPISDKRWPWVPEHLFASWHG